MKTIAPVIAILTLAFAAALHADHAGAPHKSLVNRDKANVAIQGYDPVAYHTQNKPVKGNARFTASHQGAVYHFATPSNRDLFAADPERYAPAFGGYCGYAASINRISPISPEWFQVLDGRLILQHNKKAWDLWNKDLPGNLKKANQNWPGLVEKHGK